MKTRLNSFFWLFLMLFAVSLPFTAQALDTEEVVRLHTSGYSEDEINEVLSATQAEFMLSARDVVYLSQSGVSDLVVQNMLVALPLHLVNGDATLPAEPVRLLFTQEDLQLLAENHISEPVVVTFIATRDMAFALDTERLTSLRQSGLGLEALQVLVEKSAAGLPVPLAPPPAPVVAGTSGSPAYFYGRSENSPIAWGNPFPSSYYGPDYGSGYGSNYGANYGSYYGTPFLLIQSRAIFPWYGYTGFSPFFVTHYPYSSYWSYGYGGHDLFCPRGPHHHGDHGQGGGHHNDHDDDDDESQGGTLHTGAKPDGTRPGRGAGKNNSGGNTGQTNYGNNTAGVYFGTGTKPGTDVRADTGKGISAGTGKQPVVVASRDNGGHGTAVNHSGIFNGSGMGLAAVVSHGTVTSYSGIFNGSSTRPVVSPGSGGKDQGFSVKGPDTVNRVAAIPAPAADAVTFASGGRSSANVVGVQRPVVVPQVNATAQKSSPTAPARETSANSDTALRARVDNEPNVSLGSGRREKQR